MPQKSLRLNLRFQLKALSSATTSCAWKTAKKLKMLKRHLNTHYSMSPEEYREKWGLPADYPMVAPAYAEQRRQLAKDIGLGRKKGGRKKAGE